MAEYLVNGAVYAQQDPVLQGQLEEVHRLRQRPLCMCTREGVAMYVARVGDRFVIKRMPDTGEQHAPHCESYEPPAELSGLGQVLGHAITENADSGLIALKLDFALTRTPGHAPPNPQRTVSDTAHCDGKKLSLRSVLHYLWDEAGMSKWSPRMEGKRSWFVLHKYLVQAAQGKTTKGSALGNSLYVPEPYFSDRKDEIARKRNLRLGALTPPRLGARKLMILVGEIKEIVQARYGYKAVIKQLPDFPFLMDESLLRRLERRYEVELTLWESIGTSHLMAIATFGMGAAGVASIEEMALMLCTEHWIPFETLREKELVDALTRQSRHFVKCLRYNLTPHHPLAAAVLTDTQPFPTALYLQDTGPEEARSEALQAITSKRSLASWNWWDEPGPMPALPVSARIDAATDRGAPTRPASAATQAVTGV